MIRDWSILECEETMSTFGSLDIAKKALTATQKSIDVTGHNIANANTEGYTRQRLQVASIEAKVGYSRFSSAVKGVTGGGVDVVTVDQIRNPFLDRQYHNENSAYQEWSTRAENVSYIEGLFDELSDTGITKALSEFSDSVQEASKDPVSKEYRTNMLQNALKFTETLNHYATQLADKQAEQDQSVSVVAGQINDISKTIADLNTQIERYELSGQKANDLRDQRNLLLDKLSSFVPIETQENSKGQMRVIMKGNPLQSLVEHDQTTSLVVIKDKTNTVTGEPNSLNSIYWDNGVTPADITGGSLKAYMDLRDGNTPTDIGIPYLSNQLNLFASAFAESFNAVHESGWTMLDTNTGTTSKTGVSFFTSPVDLSGVPTPVTALNITVNPDIVSNAYNIALSSTEITSSIQKSNNETALKLVDLFNSTGIPDIGGYNTFIESFVGEIAVEASHTENRVSGQKSLLDSIDQQRQSVSGVSIDEEMTNLMQYQHSYTAAARMITTIDEMLDVLINKTGTVGR